ncbi:thioredoxin domain-containing protein [Cellulomonas sp. IC4_254]|uniref:thioredoxin domain-containing protein n=1 Tax=Cellulomonas sp. IC4_254 TaxID=2714040 RepID=UPI00141F2CAA|nr:thioredoxin domain-containing protein [Cellulomonas sp. IC4_254]NHT16362.1 thioredoxin domain-containing protein [Cellulomonas sp. IC4_254]
MSNRLARSTSPYLRQHAENPVDWYEWGEEAFAEARRRDVPLLVSVGYAACHWCHVMAHESFEDERVAAVMNSRFVNVKVDREERPDLDAAYMAATQAMTGQGGWPMTVFATPEGDPFFCGTYFPPVPVGGRPSFGQVLDALSRAWRERRDEVRGGAAELLAHLGGRTAPGGAVPGGTAAEGGAPAEGDAPAEGAAAGDAEPGGADAGGPALDLDAVAQVGGLAVEALAATYDAEHGGFGGAPKFPPSTTLEWLLRRHARTGDERALAMATGTLEAMARGGMADQVGGGFARYAVDATWTVPHFEKMLEDNAMLLRIGVHWWRSTGSDLARHVVEGTADWLLRDLRTPEGAFASSLDADTDGVEGATYVWTRATLDEALGAEDGAWAADLLGVTAAGTFEAGTSVLQLRHDPAPEDEVRFARVRRALLRARSARPQPARDDKVVAAWNGLAIGALAEAGAALERREWVAAAVDAARVLDTVHTLAGGDGLLRLARTSRDGAVGTAPGVLTDYAAVAEGFMVLGGVTGDPHWAARASALLDTVLARFRAPGHGFRDTADDQTDPVVARLSTRPDVADGPSAAGQSAAAGALLARAALTGSATDRQAAELALAGPLSVAHQHPRAVAWALATAEAVLDGPREVAVVGRADDPGRVALVRAAVRSPAPGLVLAQGDPDEVADDPAAVGLLRDRPLVGGRAAAYVCRGFVCDRPTTDPGALRASLA